MDGMFGAYKVALIDSSFYLKSFSDRLRHALKETKVYVGQTFRDEVEQISRVLSERRRPVYDENLNFLIREIKLNYVNMTGADEHTAHLQNDTWGLLNLMTSLGAKFVLVTADKLLMHRVILTEKKVDIYDLNCDRFVYYDEFPVIRRGLMLDTRMESGTAEHGPIREDSVLYRKTGGPVVLEKEINSGIEGTLYTVRGNEKLVAKVFKKGKLSVNKLENLIKLQGINDVMEISWAIFPLDMLYYDEEMTIPVGFTERYIATMSNLGDDPLYIGDLPNMTDEHLEVNISQTLKLVLKIVRQVRYLNQYGFYISDYNPMNFSFRGDNFDLMQMWDTDSFGYDRYFSGYIAGDKVSRDYDVTTKTGAIDFCSEGLYVFAFKMLTLGDPPISEIRGTFKYDRPAYQNYFRKNMIPNNLWKLFDAVFHGEKEASTEVLLRELVVAVDDLRRNPSQDVTYRKLTDDVLEDEEDPVQDTAEEYAQEPVRESVKRTAQFDETGSYEKVSIKWGTQDKKKAKTDNFKMAAGWIAGILCAAAAGLAYLMLR